MASEAAASTAGDVAEEHDEADQGAEQKVPSNYYCYQNVLVHVCVDISMLHVVHIANMYICLNLQ